MCDVADSVHDTILDLSDPNIVLGPCKHYATEHLLKNSDLLAFKKKQSNQVSPGNASMTVSNASGGSADKGKHTLPPRLLLTQLTHTMLRAREATNNGESNSNGTSDTAQAIVIEDGDKGVTTDEDDDTELGACSTTLVYLH